ncbi:MAG: Zn-dependent oligopeptidase [Verrucomicrobia bacterium]|nr:Zn-dependent oligopeptidase [Verrucomicrobiota bacterium]
MMTSCQTAPKHESNPTTSLQTLNQAAKPFGSILALPDFETDPKVMEQNMEMAIAHANAALDKIASLKTMEVNFQNTIRALDDISYKADLTASRIYLMKETSQDLAIREMGIQLIKRYQDWAVGLDYREDVYRSVQAFADRKPDLSGEDDKLFVETLRDYKRAGLSLSENDRKEVEKLRKELSALSTDFDSNITKAQSTLEFTAEELKGVPSSFLESDGVKTGEDAYSVKANVTWHFLNIMENAQSETTRRRMKEARYSLAGDKNVALLQSILNLRTRIAHLLGYTTWADYQTEVKMAGNGETALTFLKELKDGLQPKFDAEIETYRKLKAEETGDANAQIHLWDWRYYSNQLKKKEYNVDAEQLRVYFPYDQTLKGMFRIYENMFDLKFQKMEPPYKWIDDLELYGVIDSETGEPMGMFYLDMFPRDGKFNHFAQFSLIAGKEIGDEVYQRPCVALICNFPSPTEEAPSLLSHNEVETLFHEFGHALHSILTRARHSRFSGTSVPRDFVEAPSQMLENWVWDKEQLDGFAADYRDPSKKIPTAILDQLKAARLATIGTHYRRQLSFGILDLELHSQSKVETPLDVIESSNDILNDVFLPVPKGTTFATYFGHLTGYDAGYYGYAWADAIAADMATVFEKSELKYADKDVARRLRESIYAPGGSRDANELILEFLGRERSLNPFLESIGIE